jgi:hypothetical protein
VASNTLGVTLGQPGSQLVSMIYTTDVPNPGMAGINPATAAQLGAAEGWSKVSVLNGAFSELRWVGSSVPCLGAILGAFFFDFVMLPFYPRPKPAAPVATAPAAGK